MLTVVSLARDRDLPDRGCASLGGHMGGKDDVERWTSLYKGFTRPGRGKKLPEPDDATLRRLREVESRAAPVSIAPPAPTSNRRERPNAGRATPAVDPPPPPPPPPPSSANDDAPPPPSDELLAAATNAPAPSDVQPRRRRQNKAELAEAQAAAKREAVRVAVRHAIGGARAEDPHLRRLEAAAKLEAEVERARAMAMGVGADADDANDGRGSAHPRIGSSNRGIVDARPPARLKTKPTDETSTPFAPPASPPAPSLTWEQHDAFLTYPPTRTRHEHELPRGLKTSQLDALYAAVEREQRRFLAHVADPYRRGVCAAMGPRGMVRAAREWALKDAARRVDPKTGDAPRYSTPAASPVAGPGLAHAFSLVAGAGKWNELSDEPEHLPPVLSLESVHRSGGSRDKPGGSSSRGVKGGVDTPNSGPSRRGSASNLSAFSGDSGSMRPHPTEAPIPPALLAACGRGVRLGEFVSSLNPPLATVLASDAHNYVPLYEDDETNAICEREGAHAALTEGALACLVANAPGRLDRAWDLPVAICAWDGENDEFGDVNGDVNGDKYNGDGPNRQKTRRRPVRAVVHVGDPLPTRDCSPATWRQRAAATYERAIARRVDDARRVRELERLSRCGPLGSLSGDVAPPVHFEKRDEARVPVVRTHAVFSLGERKIVVRSTDTEVEAGDGGDRSLAEIVRCKVEFTEDLDALGGSGGVDAFVEEEASWSEAARWWCALAARGGDPGIRTSSESANARDLTVVLCRVRARDGSVAKPPERFDADEILRRFCRDPPPPASEMARHRGVRGGGGSRTRAASRGTSLGDDDSEDTEEGEDGEDDGARGDVTDPPRWFRAHGFDPAAGIQNVASAIDALSVLPFGRYLLCHASGSDVAEVFKEVAGPDGQVPNRGKTMRRLTLDGSAPDSTEPGGVGKRRKRPAAGTGTGTGSGPPRRGKPPATAIHIPSGGRRTFGGRRMKNGGKRGHLFGGFSGVEEEEERPPPKNAKRLIVLPEIPMGVASALFIGGAPEDPTSFRRDGSRARVSGEAIGAKYSKDFEPMPGPRDVRAECAVGVEYDWAASHEKCADAERDSDEEDAEGGKPRREGEARADRLRGFEFLPPVCRTEGQIDRTPAPRGDPGAGRAKARRDQKRGNWRAVLAPPVKESNGGGSSDASDDDVPIAGLLARRERTNGAPASESDDDVPIAGLLAMYGSEKAGARSRSGRRGSARGDAKVGGGKAASRKQKAGKDGGNGGNAPGPAASPAAAESSSDDDDDDDVELEVDDDGHYVGVRYCRPFAHSGRCVRKGKCPDPHLTLREVRRMAARGETNEHGPVRQRAYATFAAVNAAGMHHQQRQQQRAPAWGNMPSLGGTRKASWARAGDSDDD